MIEFNLLWQLLAPVPRYYNRQRKCFETWQHLSDEEQKAIYDRIQKRKDNGKFVNNNPYYAIVDNQSPEEPKEMSFNDYYKKYGTTEEVDGWTRVFKPEERTTVYVKSGAVCDRDVKFA